MEDLGTISYNVWAKVKKSFSDVSVSGRFDVQSAATDIVDVDLRVEGKGAMAQVSATAGRCLLHIVACVHDAYAYTFL